MSAPINVEAFLELLGKSRLLAANAVDAYCQGLRERGTPPASPRELADTMTRDGLLTPFQADNLMAGKWRGFIINSKYRLLQRLGAGGMGCVYLCEHLVMGRRVALKVLPIAHAKDRKRMILSASARTYWEEIYP